MSKENSVAANEVRRLLRQARGGSLATLDRDTGHPYASLVNVAIDLAGRPILFISRLAWHTRNLEKNPKASLLVSEPDKGNDLAAARLTVIGEFARSDDDDLRTSYLTHHPEARVYLDFADFSFWLMRPQRVHAIAGFGRIETLDANEVFHRHDVIKS